MGTLSYMAPEQLSGSNIDQRADLFSSGVVLYEMLAGRLPFHGDTMTEIADRILNHEPDAIARYNYNVTEDVELHPPQGAQQAAANFAIRPRATSTSIC